MSLWATGQEEADKASSSDKTQFTLASFNAQHSLCLGEYKMKKKGKKILTIVVKNYSIWLILQQYCLNDMMTLLNIFWGKKTDSRDPERTI